MKYRIGNNGERTYLSDVTTSFEIKTFAHSGNGKKNKYRALWVDEAYSDRMWALGQTAKEAARKVEIHLESVMLKAMNNDLPFSKALELYVLEQSGKHFP